MQLAAACTRQHSLVMAWWERIWPHLPFFIVDAEPDKVGKSWVGLDSGEGQRVLLTVENDVLEAELLGAGQLMGIRLSVLTDLEEEIECQENEFTNGVNLGPH